MKVLLFGGAGQLGTAIRTAWSDDAIAAPARSDVDAASDAASALIREGGYDAVVNCTAFHNVDICEREAAPAFAMNAIAVDRLAAASAGAGAMFVTVSTDYVFAGDLQRAYVESDVPAPRTVYGTSKLAGEILVRRHGSRHIIVRTSGVFGTTGTSSKGYTLIDRVLGQAERGEPTRMVADMVYSPSYAPHVARTLRTLVQREAFGTHHVTNAGSCSWFDFVRIAFAKAGLADAPLAAVTYAALGNPTPRPMHSPLENTTFAPLGISPMPPWSAALDAFLTARRERLEVAQK